MFESLETQDMIIKDDILVVSIIRELKAKDVEVVHSNELILFSGLTASVWNVVNVAMDKQNGEKTFYNQIKFETFSTVILNISSNV